MVDYYKILECSQSSPAADIKKSYRRLALKWHPDKNPDNQEEATKKFKEVSEAYEVLSDEKKRKIYDQFGKEGLSNNGGGGGPTRARSSRTRSHYDPFDYSFPTFTFRDPDEVFREFFGGGDPLADLSHFNFDLFGANQRQRRRPRQRGGTGGPNVGENNYSVSNNFFGNSFQPFGGLFGFPFGDFGPFEGGGVPSNDGFPGLFTTSQTFGASNSSGAPVKRSSTSTKYINGKKITTKKVVENGKETITILENDVVKSRTVGGIAY